jgi:catechol 2,3-dioxygenase-like lactoylglutathione lyase family enzyme
MSQTTIPGVIPTPTLTTNGVHHVAITVLDLVQAEYFYGVVLELPVQRRWFEADGTTPRSIWFALGQDSFLAVERVRRDVNVVTDSTKSGWHLLALGIQCDAREAWRERLQRLGFPCTEETAYTLYCRDPEGNRVGLSHWPIPAP